MVVVVVAVVVKIIASTMIIIDSITMCVVDSNTIMNNHRRYHCEDVGHPHLRRGFFVCLLISCVWF